MSEINLILIPSKIGNKTIPKKLCPIYSLRSSLLKDFFIYTEVTKKIKAIRDLIRSICNQNQGTL